MSDKGAVAKGIGGVLVGGLLLFGRFGDDCLKVGRHAPDLADAGRIAARSGDEVGDIARGAAGNATELGSRGGADAASVAVHAEGDADLLRRSGDLMDVVEWSLPLDEGEVGSASSFAEEAAAIPKEEWGWSGGELPDLSGAWCSALSFQLDDARIDIQQRLVLSRDGAGYRTAGSLWVVPDGLFEWERIDLAGVERYGAQEVCTTFTKLNRLQASPEAHARLKASDSSYYAMLEGQLSLAFSADDVGTESCLPLVVLEPGRFATMQDGTVVPTVRCE